MPFVRDDDEILTPGEAKETPRGELAQLRARAMAGASGIVGAVAYSLTTFGDVHINAVRDVRSHEVDPTAFGQRSRLRWNAV